jgi:rhodanese-related sulfurtransferase
VSHARLSAAECAALIDARGYAYLDVRTEQEFAIEHAAGAYNVPWKLRGPSGQVDNPHFLAVVNAVFARDRGLIVGCHEGVRSRAAAAALVSAGFSRVVEQRAGHAGSRDAFGRRLDVGWAAAGLPCAAEPTPGRDYASLRSRLTPRA